MMVQPVFGVRGGMGIKPSGESTAWDHCLADEVEETTDDLQLKYCDLLSSWLRSYDIRDQHNSFLNLVNWYAYCSGLSVDEQT